MLRCRFARMGCRAPEVLFSSVFVINFRIGLRLGPFEASFLALRSPGLRRDSLEGSFSVLLETLHVCSGDP